MGKDEAPGLRGKEAPSGNRWAPLSEVKDLALQPFLPSLGRLWDGKEDGELIPCRFFCSEEEEARSFNPQGNEGNGSEGRKISQTYPLILLP